MEEQTNEALWYVVHTYSGYENKVANDSPICNYGLLYIIVIRQKLHPFRYIYRTSLAAQRIIIRTIIPHTERGHKTHQFKGRHLHVS